MERNVVKDEGLDEPLYIFILGDELLYHLSNVIKTHGLDRKACGLILLLIYVFSSYSAVTCLHHIAKWQADIPETACGCAIITLFLVLTYVYGVCFGVFPYNLPQHSDVEKDPQKASTSQEEDQKDSESIKGIGDYSFEELTGMLEKISQDNDKRIKAVNVKNSERIQQLSRSTEARTKAVIESGEYNRSLYISEMDKYIKISTVEVDEYLKLLSAYTGERLRLSIAAMEDSLKSKITQYIEDIQSQFNKDVNRIRIHLTEEEEKLKVAVANSYNRQLANAKRIILL